MYDFLSMKRVESTSLASNIHRDWLAEEGLNGGPGGYFWKRVAKYKYNDYIRFIKIFNNT